jgi:hypothetical protein
MSRFDEMWDRASPAERKAIDLQAGAVCLAWGRYYGSPAWWRARRRKERMEQEERRMERQQRLWDAMKEFSRWTRGTWTCVVQEKLHAEWLAENLAWLREHLPSARKTLLDAARYKALREHCRHFARDIELAECFIEVIHLEDVP